MYVRDRLEADYATWKKNGRKEEVKLTWAKEPNARRLLELLDSHRTLSVATPKNNWVCTFRDSVDLKRQLEKEFRSIFCKATAERLFYAGRVPLLEILGQITAYNNQTVSFGLTVKNLSTATAVTPKLAIKATTNAWTMPSLTQFESHKITDSWHYAG